MKQPQISSSLNPVQLLSAAQELRNSLQSIQPDNSKTSQTITFALVAAAVLGVFVYHYIKSHEVNSEINLSLAHND